MRGVGFVDVGYWSGLDGVGYLESSFWVALQFYIAASVCRRAALASTYEAFSWFRVDHS